MSLSSRISVMVEEVIGQAITNQMNLTLMTCSKPFLVVATSSMKPLTEGKIIISTSNNKDKEEALSEHSPMHKKQT